MRAIVVSVVLLTGSVVNAQGYYSPAWQTPIYAPGYGAYTPQYGAINQIQSGPATFSYGTGAFQGYSGTTINSGTYSQSTYTWRSQHLQNQGSFARIRSGNVDFYGGSVNGNVIRSGSTDFYKLNGMSGNRIRSGNVDFYGGALNGSVIHSGSVDFYNVQPGSRFRRR